MKPTFRYAAPAVLSLMLTAAFPAQGLAFQVKGKVINGTTGTTEVGTTIEVINPRRGMAVEQKLTADSGVFTTDELSDTTHVYMFRVVFKGVSYSKLIRFQGTDPVQVEFEVFDSTSSWERIRVSIPHFMVRRAGDHLQIEKIFEVNNISDPPQTVVGEGLPMYIPEDRIGINAFYTTEFGLPIKQTPTPTEQGGIYRFIYPFKPGVTRVALSFDVPYLEDTYHYREVLPVDIEALTLLTDDRSLDISSETTSFERDINSHGFVSLNASSLSKSSELSIRFSGGSKDAPPEKSGGSHVIVRTKGIDGLSMPLIVLPALLLLVLTTFTAKTRIDKKVETDFIKSKCYKIINQIARLDDLHTTGTVPEGLYRTKRMELKSQLSQILRGQRALAGDMARKQKENKEEQ